jgi:hypothetical protein
MCRPGGIASASGAGGLVLQLRVMAIAKQKIHENRVAFRGVIDWVSFIYLIKQSAQEKVAGNSAVPAGLDMNGKSGGNTLGYFNCSCGTSNQSLT